MIQRIANDSSDGKSGKIIDQYTVDNKKILINNMTNIATKKNISSDDIKKTIFESFLSPTSLQKFKREINNNSNNHIISTSNSNSSINSSSSSSNSSNSSSSSSSSSNSSNSSNNYNTINKNSILPYENLNDEKKKQDDYTLQYIGIAFCTFIFCLQKI